MNRTRRILNDGIGGYIAQALLKDLHLPLRPRNLP